MPHNAKVFIHYGPYDSCGIVDHQEHRLDGLKCVLETDGHTTQLQQIKDWNVVELYVNGELVFKCDIRELDYGGDGILDPLCADALKAVQHAF